jgi:uncharacterized membrane protein YfcA
MISLLIGLFTGLSLGLTGAGGAIIAVPLMMYFLGESISSATGLSLAIVMVGTTVGTFRLTMQKHIQFQYKLIAFMALGGLIFAPIGRSLSFMLPEQILIASFTLLTLFMAWRLWLGNSNLDVKSPGALSVPTLLLSSVFIGLLSGLFGVGGGFLLVPLLRHLGLSFVQASSHSLAVISIISAIGFISHLMMAESIPLQFLPMLAAGVTIGIIGGIFIQSKTNVKTLQRGFSLLLLGSAGLLIFQSIS